jgi:hypothetical protein
MQKIKYYCDKCGKEIEQENIIIKSVPNFESVETKSHGITVAKLCDILVIKNMELCPGCSCVFDILYNQNMYQLAQDWINFDQLLKITNK